MKMVRLSAEGRLPRICTNPSSTVAAPAPRPVVEQKTLGRGAGKDGLLKLGEDRIALAKLCHQSVRSIEARRWRQAEARERRLVRRNPRMENEMAPDEHIAVSRRLSNHGVQHLPQRRVRHLKRDPRILVGLKERDWHGTAVQQPHEVAGQRRAGHRHGADPSTQHGFASESRPGALSTSVFHPCSGGARQSGARPCAGQEDKQAEKNAKLTSHESPQFRVTEPWQPPATELVSLICMTWVSRRHAPR